MYKAKAVQQVDAVAAGCGQRHRELHVRLRGILMLRFDNTAAWFGGKRVRLRWTVRQLGREERRQVLSLSDYASLLLFIWRFVWGLYERAHIIRLLSHARTSSRRGRRRPCPRPTTRRGRRRRRGTARRARRCGPSSRR
jgi:hypothetical protein